MTNERKLDGKVAVVTGGARNLGRALATMLAEEGAKLVIHHRSSESAADAEETAESVRRAGSEAVIFVGDLIETGQIDKMFSLVDERFSRLDILINNAGAVIKKPFLEISETEYDRIFAINAKAAFFCMQAAARRMADGGRIVNLGTTLLGATTGLYSIYAGSKAPLEDFTRSLAKEVGARGITANVVAPGPLDTSFFYPAETPESVEFLKHMSVTGELGQVSDVVPLIRFLVSPDARWITAQTIFVNGGFVAR